VFKEVDVNGSRGGAVDYENMMVAFSAFMRMTMHAMENGLMGTEAVQGAVCWCWWCCQVVLRIGHGVLPESLAPHASLDGQQLLL